VMRSAERMEFMLKATRSRNERRGLMYLKKYLQAIWPNVWLVEPLWQPLSSAIYPDDAVSLAKPKDLGSGVTAEYDADGNPSVYRTDWQGKQLLYSTPRTNLLKYSEQFDNAAWEKNNCTITPNDIAAPDGTITADKIARTATGNHYLLQNYAVADPSGMTFCFFIWLKGGTYTGQNRIWIKNGAGATIAFFTLTMTSEWVRYQVTGTFPAASPANVGIYIDPSNDTGAAGEYFYAWGADLKTGPLSSYIPTAAAPVTVTDYAVATNGVATFASGPAPSVLLYFRTGRIRVTLPVTADNGLGLAEIARAFRSTLAARLMLLLQLGIVFENIGANGGLALSNAAIGIMPFTAIGTLQGPSPP
jgi:hypothetical protein